MTMIAPPTGSEDDTPAAPASTKTASMASGP
jgi:hypothetical protein